ncbi:hypothetical protein AKO1_010675 [Acrasis kona]|uniref:Protein FRA10AC1 n=1 Tax=Acrasis kona TaxID=1008807 RepID=A0AAW2ZIZ6_9EUKA
MQTIVGEENIDKFLQENSGTLVNDTQHTKKDIDKHSDEDVDKISKTKKSVAKSNGIRPVSSARDNELNYIKNYVNFYNDSGALKKELKKEREEELSKFKSNKDILKEHYQFIRDENNDELDTKDTLKSYGEKLAKQYESGLFREYCVANLEKYKQGLIGLRWRTEKEVLSDVGRDTCGSVTCKKKNFRASKNEITLSTVEVNFAYKEHGENKNALVKMCLCKKCLKKMNKANSVKKKRSRDEDDDFDKNKSSKKSKH